MNTEDKKFLTKVIIVYLVALAVITAIHLFDEPKVEAWDYHTVQYGDTLWDMAKEHNPSYKGDLREIMYCIQKANGMKGSTVYVGHVYYVPVME